MSKKYLSIEEAASAIGIPTSELNRLREKGTIRAFADRGTWKFKEEDVETLARSRQADSNPDVPLQKFGEGDSGADLVFSDDDALAQQPTIIGRADDDSGSDSDVRLIFDDAMHVPKGGDSLEDSDSDVKLAGAEPPDSDSDVKLAGSAPSSVVGGSDSDVKLVSEGAPTDVGGSDSDVRLVSSDSSGEVQLAGGPGSDVDSSVVGGSDVYPGGVKSGGSSIALAGDKGSVLDDDDDSGISLAEGSGLALASDSGISLEQPNDSGISLSEESSIVLADSGISLAADSGISLAGEAPVVKKDKAGGKKGKGKAKPADSDDDMTGTIPLMDAASGADSDDVLDTQMEVPMLDSGDDSSVIGSSGGATSVITLDDEEQDEYSVTSVKGHADASEAEILDEDAVLEDEEETLVSDDLIGEDDELSEDVFGAEDEDFASDVESGESSSELPVAPRGMVAVGEQDWGAGTFVGLTLSSLLLLVCGTVMLDLVRNMWYTSAAKQNPLSTLILDSLKGMM